MKYHCKNCSYSWEGNSDTFANVLIHEKTHLKTKHVDSIGVTA